ncbi:MAG: hypothetical protein IID08_03940 [Candidatus Hydrogenedentes bacterium]|nr:hypothetical protein [Candidatus Hydrogenedentota bacterium]
MSKASAKQTNKPWEGPKNGRITIRCTESDRESVLSAANRSGGMSMSRYLMRLHYKKEGIMER